jgi:hypothetical protein
MARKNRFTEARVWMAAGTLTLLMAAWAGLAVQDASTRLSKQDSSANQTSQSTQSSQSSQVRQTRVTHTRTRGS